MSNNFYDEIIVDLQKAKSLNDNIKSLRMEQDELQDKISKKFEKEFDFDGIDAHYCGFNNYLIIKGDRFGSELFDKLTEMGFKYDVSFCNQDGNASIHLTAKSGEVYSI